MKLRKNQRLRLDEKDECPHAVEPVANFNESMYVNVFDHRQELGGWFRVGNRPNEGYAEVSCCVYLPGGRVAFMFQRPAIDGNDRIAAGGMSFEIVEPFREVRLSHRGQVCVLQEPAEMENPKKAFQTNPIAPCEVELFFTSCAPAYGGEAVDEHGKPVEEKPEESFARAHYEQHMVGSGSIKVGAEAYSVRGLGLRDHSWGPRYWQNIYWYRWLPMSFTEDFAMSASIVAMSGGQQQVWGMVLRGDDYHAIERAELRTRWDESDYPLGYRLSAEAGNERYEIEAEVISQIPLRNRRKKDDGERLQTRIVEGFTRFRCNGTVGYGMSEFLDQMVGGHPVGNHPS